MAAGLGRAGYDDYRPSDAAVFRRLLRRSDPRRSAGRRAGSHPTGRPEDRGGAGTAWLRDDGARRDGRPPAHRVPHPGRRGVRPGRCRVIEALNQEIAVRVPPDDLAAARRVLFEVMSGDERVRRLDG